MTLTELYALAQRHSEQVWGPDSGELGAGHLVMERFGIDAEDATRLCHELARTSTAYANPGVPHLAALLIQGLVFGLWLSEQPGVRA